jgi:acylaminoacyl-peptidase
MEEVWYKGADKNDLQGWILKPPGFSASKKYASILEIHGGPQTQYGNHFMHEFYLLAAQGYVVHFTNPRGGTGYGREHTKAIIANMGDRDYADMMAWTDLIEKKPYIDKTRMGVTGGSYGGYMTAWIIGNTNRFAAAVAQRAVTNWVSMMGSSDFNWRFNDWMGDILPWDGEKEMLRIWRQSPMSKIGKHVKTPTMVIHSQMDQRVEQEQGEQLYVALRQMGVPTELVLFPDSPHGLSRTGRTDRRIERLNSIIRWMDTHLKNGKK